VPNAPVLPMTAWRVAVAGVAVMATACTSGPAPPAADAPQAEVVLEAREALGEPMLDLAEAVVELSEGLDAARHRARRGEEMAGALDDVEQQITTVRDAAAGGRAAADEAPVDAAAQIVREAADRADAAADAAAAELSYLRDLNRVDLALIGAAATWDAPGSQSEIRARLDGLDGQVAAQRRRVRRLRPVPRRCSAMVDNRREWIGVVRRRTANLRANAHSGAGETFDRLRAAYRPLPFGVEPRIADRADLQCWERRSGVPRAADDLRGAVDELRRSLSG